MSYNSSSVRGFTLIELMVVITIIGLLASSVLVALGNARAKARDARRTADIRQVMTALELYANDNTSGYPTCTTVGTSCEFTTTNISGLVPGYIDKMPIAPSGDNYVYYDTADTVNEGYAIVIEYEKLGASNTALTCYRGANADNTDIAASIDECP